MTLGVEHEVEAGRIGSAEHVLGKLKGRIDFARSVVTELLGPENYIGRPAPIMGAEDFSYVLQRMPGCLMFLGVMPEGHREHDHVAPCHSNRMMLNEDCMAAGIAMHASIAHRYLTQSGIG